jgi:type III pantothenate kinase
MSWLVVDAGNTAVKWAVSDRGGHRFVGGGVEAHVGADSLEERLRNIWTGLPLSGAFGVSVAGAPAMRAIDAAVRAASRCEMVWYGPQRHFEGRGVAHGVALLNGYRDPMQLGADRWHAMVAACAKYPDQSLVVVSAGTATTVDCIRAEPLSAAVFTGGVIAPGFDLMRDSLARGTARLPQIDDMPIELLTRPNNTGDAMLGGVLYAQLGLVENVVREFAAELEHAQKEPARLLLTGGKVRPLIAPLSRSVLAERAVSAICTEQNLVLRGVALRAHNERGEALPAEQKLVRWAG